MQKGVTMSNYNGQFQDSGANILLPTPHSYANIEGATASQAYIKGQMIVFNNRLCEVTSAITSGDTLTIGSNIAYKNVGDIGKQLVATDGTGFYFDVKDGEYGFYPSASKLPEEFVPFGGTAPIEVYRLTTVPEAATQTADLASAITAAGYDYKKLTVDNFIFVVIGLLAGTGGSGGSGGWASASITPTFSYDASTGVYTMYNMYKYSSSANGVRVRPTAFKILLIPS